jgi:hypothetical protein
LFDVTFSVQADSAPLLLNVNQEGGWGAG